MLRAPTTSRWFRCPRPEPRAALRLFCFPHAGGGASTFRSWHGAMAGVETVAVQPPGREDRFTEPPLSTVAALVDAVDREMELGGWLDRPVALFGHSFGAYAAFELARRLRARAGVTPVRLIVSGAQAPRARRRWNVAGVSDGELVAALASMGGTPEEILRDEELARIFLLPTRADLVALDRHVFAPEAPLACPISAWGGSADPTTPAGELDGWEAETARGLTRRIFEGDHFYLRLHEPAMFALLRQALEGDLLEHRGARGANAGPSGVF